MQKRKLGTFEVSPIGMGCMGFSHGYGEIPDEGYSIEAIRGAHEFGCTFFDTAESYGPQLLPENLGHNERIVGKALKPFRDDVAIATKIHLPVGEVRGKGLERTVREHLAASLERLRTDHVELYYLHRVNRAIPVEDVAAVMGKLVSEGLIGGWGLSQVPLETIRAANEVAPLTAVQNIYNMIERGTEEVEPYLIDHGIALVPFSPIASGFLSGKVTAETDFSNADDVRKYVPQLKEGNIEANRPVLDLLGRFAEAKGATMAQVSLAWMLRKWPNVIPIPGSKNKERIIENLGAWNVGLTAGEFEELEGALEKIPVAGHRGYVQFEGDAMSNWGEK